MVKQCKNRSLLIFSIALNGYQWICRDCLRSHQEYAQRLDADYVKVTRPWFTDLGIECCWLKLLLLRQALAKGYEQVLFLDADALVQHGAPDIRDEMRPDKYIYMAKGKTRRYNSGVILLVNSEQARDFIDKVIQSRKRPLAEQHDVGWGENGHVIQVAEHNHWVAELDTKWNNTFQPTLPDHIRHYNHGIMRNQIPGYRVINLIHRYLAKATRGINHIKKPGNALHYAPKQTDNLQQLQQLLLVTQRIYPQIF